jgi:hypothetical protein
LPSPSMLRIATSPKGRGFGSPRKVNGLPLGELSPKVTERALVNFLHSA